MDIRASHHDLIVELFFKLRSDMATGTGLPLELSVHPPDDIVHSLLLAEHHALPVRHHP
jgi:hypothetical protein